MAKNTSILLGEHFENFIAEKVASGQYTSVSEVVRSALRLFEQEENKVNLFNNELKAGEKSKILNHFNPKDHLKKLHAKHLNNEL